jgi:hypothetical protein
VPEFPIAPGRVQLARALDDLDMYRNLLVLLPYTVHRDHRAERANSRIPVQRRPAELWPRTLTRSS